MSKQTAVEWLADKLNNVRPTQICSIETIKEWVEQAKEMEKQQIIDACDQIEVIGLDHELPGEKYYNEQFNK